MPYALAEQRNWWLAAFERLAAAFRSELESLADNDAWISRDLVALGWRSRTSLLHHFGMASWVTVRPLTLAQSSRAAIVEVALRRELTAREAAGMVKTLATLDCPWLPRGWQRATGLEFRRAWLQEPCGDDLTVLRAVLLLMLAEEETADVNRGFVNAVEEWAFALEAGMHDDGSELTPLERLVGTALDVLWGGGGRADAARLMKEVPGSARSGRALLRDWATGTIEFVG